ncbi:MAG TPA: ABC transporter transmembrane domain-containing protein [Oligoflexus sp.]|uniref:peptidase domain-containing ABC transporter n=1 Tax=Oligoflexus sp. TaxID=1971216 RepID=UPI002D6A72FC|nr:ABC transporter transmembrane domain-containing protein [Oligoflexus sp.]HYX34419.1 ABC transporter transmembrane domain-containing protein [Oligoflexus sp.]
MKLSQASRAPSPFYHSLFLILDGLRWRGNRAFMEKFIRGDKQTMTLNDLLQTLAALRFAPVRDHFALKDISQDELPCIIIRKMRPILLVQGHDKTLDGFDILGEQKVELKRGSGTYETIRFKRLEKDEVSPHDSQADWFTQMVSRFKAYGFYVFSLSFLINVLNIVAPLIIVIVFKQIEAAKSLDNLLNILYGLGLYISFLTVIRLTRSQVLNYLSSRVGYLIGSQVMRRILYLPPSYTEVASVAAQMARVRDFDTIQQFIPGLGTDALLDIPFALMMVLALFLLSGPLALVPLSALAIFAAFGYLMRKKIEYTSSEASKHGKERHDFFMDTLNNLEQIQVQYLLPFWQERFLKVARRASVSVFRAASLTSLVSSFSYFTVTLTGLATIIIGVHMVKTGQLDAGRLMASMLLTWKILAPMRNGFSFLLQIDKVKKTIAQVDRLMALPQEEISEDAYEIDKEIKGSVHFQQVSLKYSNDAHPALLGVNFQVEPNETLVIFGHGGSGQTSVLKLILGLYIPQAGRVLIDNKHSRQINPTFLRENIAYLPEEPTVFSGTMRHSLQMFAPKASDAEIDKVFSELGLWEKVNALPDRLDTVLDRQEQAHLGQSFLKRLNLAMLLLRDCNLWLLDNPGSAQENHEIVQVIRSLKGKATIIIASKNTDYFEFCDKVLWLNSGRVQFFGSPQEMTNNLQKAAGR